MRFTWITALKDLRQRLRDPASLLIWAGIPFGILLLFTLAFGSGGNVKPQATLLVVDLDESLLSGLIAGAFNQGELADLVDVETVSAEDGERRIREGDGSALLTIPEGFGEKVLKNEPVALRLKTNPAQRILPGIVQGVLEVLVDGTFYLQQVLADPIRQILDSTEELSESPSDLLISSVSVEINHTIERLEKYLLPPVIELKVEEERKAAADETGGPGFGGIFFQSMLFMFLLFAAQGVSDDLWKERQEGTLRRVLATPRSLARYLLGKVIAGVMVTGAILAAAVAAGTWLFELPWSAYLPSLFWLALLAGSLISFFTCLQLLATSRRGGSILLSMIIFPMMMVGGSFFPPEMMPAWLAGVGKWTPNGFGLRVLKTIQAGSADLSSLSAASAGTALVTVLLLWLASLRLRRSFASSTS